MGCENCTNIADLRAELTDVNTNVKLILDIVSILLQRTGGFEHFTSISRGGESDSPSMEIVDSDSRQDHSEVYYGDELLKKLNSEASATSAFGIYTECAEPSFDVNVKVERHENCPNGVYDQTNGFSTADGSNCEAESPTNGCAHNVDQLKLSSVAAGLNSEPQILSYNFHRIKRRLKPLSATSSMLSSSRGLNSSRKVFHVSEATVCDNSSNSSANAVLCNNSSASCVLAAELQQDDALVAFQDSIPSSSTVWPLPIISAASLESTLAPSSYNPRKKPSSSTAALLLNGGVGGAGANGGRIRKRAPIVCEQCGATFANMSNLNRHMVFHTGEKRYECEVCGSRFWRNDVLKSHMRKFHGFPPSQSQQHQMTTTTSPTSNNVTFSDM